MSNLIEQETAVAPGRQQTGMTPVQILVVEDSITQAVHLRLLLQKHGYAVSVCHNGEAALRHLKEHSSTVIISDIIMPGMDGYELCRLVREDPQLTDIPIILMTALSDPREIIKALASGATNFVTKPFDPHLLLARVENILRNKAMREESRDKNEVRVFFAGESYSLTIEPSQIVDLLFSSYETAVIHQRQLEEANKSLSEANEKLERLTSELQELSLVDPLTGLNNRRGFFHLAEQQLAMARRHKKPMILLYIDLDDLKKINDTFGHQQGDRALRETAEILKATFRSSDIVTRFARLGGDEFVVLIVEPTVATVESLVNRIENNVREFNRREQRPYRIALSIGAAVFSSDEPCSIDEMLAQADRMMYQTKKKKKIAGLDRQKSASAAADGKPRPSRVGTR